MKLKRAIAALLCAAMLPLGAVSAYAEETVAVTVDYSVSAGTADRAASGMLHAFDYHTPAEWLTDGVYIQSIRGQAHHKEFNSDYNYLPGFFDEPTYNRLTEINPDATMMIGLYYGYAGKKGSSWKSASISNGGKEWKEYIHTLMSEAYDKNGNKVIPVYSWIPYNEPDLQWGSSYSTGFFQGFQYAYEAVKDFDARELVQGPENTKYNKGNITAFLSYCKEHDCLPDVLSWHELTNSRVDIEAHCKELTEWMTANGIEPMPFAITEYQGTGYATDEAGRKSQGNYNTGLTISYLAMLERSAQYGLAYGLQSSWGLPGENTESKASLGDMSDFETATMPTGLWYVYHKYKEMTGVKPKVTVDTTKLDAIAAADSSADKRSSRVLIGNWEEIDKTAAVTLSNLPDYLKAGDTVHIKVERINETLATACYGTDIISNTDYTVNANNSIELSIPVKARSAVAITVTPPSENTAAIKMSELSCTASNGVTITNGQDGIITAGGITAPNYSSNGTKVYNDTGAEISFTVNADKSGIYHLSSTHKTGTDKGFMQMYVDGESVGNPIDLYSVSESEYTVDYGNVYLAKGAHTVTYKSVGFGKNEASSGYALTFGSFTLAPIKDTAANTAVTFNANRDGASLSQNSVSLKSGEKLGFLPDAKCKDCVLTGWNTKSDGSGETVTTDTVVNSNITAYAQWKLSYSAKLLQKNSEYCTLTVADNTASITVTPPDAESKVKLYANNKDISAQLTYNGGSASAQISLTESTVFGVDIIAPIGAVVISGNTPILPAKVNVELADGTVAEKEVTWNTDTITDVNTATTFDITGTYDAGTTSAKVTVLPCTDSMPDITAGAQYTNTIPLNRTYTSPITVEFDWQPTEADTFEYIGFGNGNDMSGKNTWGTQAGPQIVINTGKLTGRNGTGANQFTDGTPHELTIGEAYRIRMEITPSASGGKYSAWYTDPDGSCTQFAKDYGFRSNMASLSYLTVENNGITSGSSNVSNFKIYDSTGSPVTITQNYIYNNATIKTEYIKIASDMKGKQYAPRYLEVISADGKNYMYSSGGDAVTVSDNTVINLIYVDQPLYNVKVVEKCGDIVLNETAYNDTPAGTTITADKAQKRAKLYNGKYYVLSDNAQTSWKADSDNAEYVLSFTELTAENGEILYYEDFEDRATGFETSYTLDSDKERLQLSAESKKSTFAELENGFTSDKLEIEFDWTTTLSKTYITSLYLTDSSDNAIVKLMAFTNMNGDANKNGFYFTVPTDKPVYESVWNADGMNLLSGTYSAAAHHVKVVLDNKKVTVYFDGGAGVTSETDSTAAGFGKLIAFNDYGPTSNYIDNLKIAGAAGAAAEQTPTPTAAPTARPAAPNELSYRKDGTALSEFAYGENIPSGTTVGNSAAVELAAYTLDEASKTALAAANAGDTLTISYDIDNSANTSSNLNYRHGLKIAGTQFYVNCIGSGTAAIGDWPDSSSVYFMNSNPSSTNGGKATVTYTFTLAAGGNAAAVDAKITCGSTTVNGNRITFSGAASLESLVLNTISRNNKNAASAYAKLTNFKAVLKPTVTAAEKYTGYTNDAGLAHADAVGFVATISGVSSVNSLTWYLKKSGTEYKEFTTGELPTISTDGAARIGLVVYDLGNVAADELRAGYTYASTASAAAE